MKDVKEFLNNKADGLVQWLKKPDDSVAHVRLAGIWLFNIGIWSAMWWQNGALDRTYGKLDADKSVLFTSVSDCVAQNYKLADCQCSWEQAKLAADKVSFGYTFEDDVASHHQRYNSLYITQRNRLTGKTRIKSQYEPAISGWQASYHNICDVSVPVYSGPKPHTHVRGDGRLINCNCPVSP